MHHIITRYTQYAKRIKYDLYQQTSNLKVVPNCMGLETAHMLDQPLNENINK